MRSLNGGSVATRPGDPSVSERAIDSLAKGEDQEPERGARWRPPLALALAMSASLAMLVLVTALLLGGGGPQPSPEGLPDAGLMTGWGLPLARVAFDVSAIGTIGCLLVAVLAGPVGGLDLRHGRLSPQALGATRAASRWAAGWCAATLAALLFSLSDLVGVPFGRLLSWAMLSSLPWTVPVSLSLTATAAACLALFGFGRRTVTRAGARVLLVLALAALVPILFTGHATTAADHDLATSALVVHVLAAALWVGGLMALLMCVRSEPAVLATVLPRFSNLALGCFAVVGFSGSLGAFLRLGPNASTWLSWYGALVVAKAAALVLLGWWGHVHRRRSIPRVVTGRPHAFLRLAGGEVVIMGAVVGLAVALGRTPAPATPGRTAAPAHGIGHDTLSWVVLPWSPMRVLTEWRPDAIVLTAVGLAAAAYLVGVRRLGRRGRRWPVRRTASAIAGLGLATFALCGGVAGYSTALLSMQVTQVLALATVVPLLLTLGMPLALMVQVREGEDTDGARPRPALLAGKAARALANPVNGLLLIVAIFVGLYATPLFEMSLRYFTVHLLVNVLVLAGGLSFFWSAMAVDALPERRARTDRALFVAAFLLFLMAFGAVLVTSDGLYGASWFADLRWSWADPVADQRRAGVMVCVLAAVLAPVAWLVLRKQSGRPGHPAPALEHCGARSTSERA